MAQTSEARSKSFLVCFALVFVIGLSCVIFANYWVDPANAFHTKYTAAERAAEILASGRNLGMARNLDDRLVQWEYVRQIKRLPEVIAIGSSRSREISIEVAPPGLRFFNHGVNGASIGDAVAILGLYLQRSHLPKLVIWSVDPWIFNSQFTDSRWRSLTDSYLYAAGKIGLDTKPEAIIDQFRDVKERGDLLLRLEPAVEFVRALVNGDGLHGALDRNVQAVDGENWNRLLVYHDGSFRWGPDILQRTDEEVGRFGNEAAQKGLLRSINDFNELDRDRLEIFGKVVEYLLSKRVKLVIFLPPYQPDAYAVFKGRESYEGVFLAEAWLRALAERHGVALVGSYDPKRAGCGKGDFVDAHHPRRVCVNRLLGGVLTEYMR